MPIHATTFPSCATTSESATTRQSSFLYSLRNSLVSHWLEDAGALVDLVASDPERTVVRLSPFVKIIRIPGNGS
jgi:hypothetical protein